MIPSGPEYVGVGMEGGLAPRGLSLLIPSTNTPSVPISAMFLVQFDVHSGYELKWSKSIGNVSLKGVEYKCLPSGLHEKERDVISFVQPAKGDSDDLDDILYGVAVFHQNLTESNASERSTVKMFSLGVLVDPSKHLGASNSSRVSNMVWKPASFSRGIEHIEQLKNLLESWDERDGYDVFEKFFDQKSDMMNIMSSPTSPRTQRVLRSSENTKDNNHHYLLKLDKMIETLGPLIFKLWRLSLLRERIILFDAESVELNCAFAYCLSILSTTPLEIQSILNDHAAKNLQFNPPIFSVGVNDIDWLKLLNGQSLESGFVASSTDEILMFKSMLYDTAVQFRNHDVSHPRMFPSKMTLPGTSHVSEMKATQRDLKRFNVLVREYGLYKEFVDNSDDDSLSWWLNVTEPVSWRHMAWSGFYWWASAGEKQRLDDETYREGVSEFSGGDSIERLLSIVGYFQSLSKKIIRTINDILLNDKNRDEEGEPVTIEYSDFIEMGLDPYSGDDIQFVIRLIKLWWDRDAKVGSSLSSVCCF
jgi:hypothetical protein